MRQATGLLPQGFRGRAGGIGLLIGAGVLVVRGKLIKMAGGAAEGVDGG
jgi:hypothetical protein